MNLDASGRALPRQYNYQRINQEYSRHYGLNGHHSNSKRSSHSQRNSSSYFFFGGGPLRLLLQLCGALLLVGMIFGFGLYEGMVNQERIAATHIYDAKPGKYEELFDRLFSEVTTSEDLAKKHKSYSSSSMPGKRKGMGEKGGKENEEEVIQHKEDLEGQFDHREESDASSFSSSFHVNQKEKEEAAITETFREKVFNLLKGRQIQNGGLSSGLPPVTLHFDQNGNLLGNSVKVGKSNGVNVKLMEKEDKRVMEEQGDMRGKEEKQENEVKKEKSENEIKNEQIRLRGSSRIVEKRQTNSGHSEQMIEKENERQATWKKEKREEGKKNLNHSLGLDTAFDDRKKIDFVDGLIDTPILIISHDRADYLKRTLNAILKHHPCQNLHHRGKGLVPIVISEDGQHPKMKNVIDDFRKEIQQVDSSVMVYHIIHQQDMSLQRQSMGGYLMLSQHFKWALNRVFQKNYPGKAFENSHQQAMATVPDDIFHSLDPLLPFEVKNVIILEEDIEISPDFFVYFGSFIPLLYLEDAGLLTISAWNDNGISGRVKHDPGQFYRSDFFPGLGWVMTSKLWDELGPGWPRGFWDDWMREPPQRKARQIIRPDLSRTLHFGDRGTSSGQHSEIWRSISLAENTAQELEEIINTKLNISPNKSPQESIEMDGSTFSILGNDHLYHNYIQDEISKAETIEMNFVKRNFLNNNHSNNNHSYLDDHVGKSYKLYYDGHQGPNGFEKIAKALGIMSDEKAMVPRTAYEGIVLVWVNNSRTKLFLTPRQPPTKNYKI